MTPGVSRLSTVSVTAAATENGGWEGGRLIGALVSHFASVADTPRKGCFWPLRACFERKPRLAARPWVPVSPPCPTFPPARRFSTSALRRTRNISMPVCSAAKSKVVCLGADQARARLSTDTRIGFRYDEQGQNEPTFTLRPAKKSCRSLAVSEDGASLWAVGKAKSIL
jgi:hypothetical protein